MTLTYLLVTPIGKRYYGAAMRPSELAASMEALRKKGIIPLAKAFYCDFAQMISLCQDDLDNPGQFDSVKDLCKN
jgi:hypothetical protein